MTTMASRTRPLAIALAAVLLSAATAAHAARIEPTGVGRHAIRALAGTFDGTVVEDENAIDELTLPPFDDEAGASIQTGDALASSSAALFTELDATFLQARGTAAGTARAAGDIRATARGDTLFRFEFTVDEETPFELLVDLWAAGDQPFVSVFFSEDALGTRFERQLPGSGQETLRGVLEPGVFYSFSANAVIGAFAGGPGSPALASEEAGFDLRLRLPEPASGIGLGVACLAFGLRRRRAPSA